MVRKAFVCLVIATVSVLVPAQDPGSEKSVDSRLLEILKQRGVITDAEFGELKQLETELKKESDLEGNVNAKVSEMMSRMADDAPKLSYKPGNGFTLKSANGLFSLTVGGRIMVRATY